MIVYAFTIIHNSDIDECASNTCDNGGTCVDLVNGHRCQCVDGYTGEQCKAGELRQWLS